MAGFNFGSIGNIIGNVMDSDQIDIGREELIIMPDGSTTITDANTPQYRNVPCHLSFSNIDNPDPVSVGSIPIIVALTINCSIDVDIQNADTVWARKLSHAGEVLESYKGIIGAPATNQGRKEAIMAVRQAV